MADHFGPVKPVARHRGIESQFYGSHFRTPFQNIAPA